MHICPDDSSFMRFCSLHNYAVCITLIMSLHCCPVCSAMLFGEAPQCVTTITLLGGCNVQSDRCLCGRRGMAGSVENPGNGDANTAQDSYRCALPVNNVRIQHAKVNVCYSRFIYSYSQLCTFLVVPFPAHLPHLPLPCRWDIDTGAAARSNRLPGERTKSCVGTSVAEHKLPR
jgi:hypothetical protein